MPEGAATRRCRLMLGLMVLLALLLRLWRVGARPLTSDELWNLHVIGRGWGDMLRLAATDTFPPLSYAVLKLWTGLAGTSDAALRLPAVAAGVAAVPVMFLLGATLVSRGVGWLAAGLFALSGFWLVQAQDARLYSLTTLCCLVSWWAYARWRWEGRRPIDLGVWWVATALGVYSHYLVWPLWLGQNLSLWPERRRLPRGWWYAQAGLAAAYVPWLLLLAHPASRAAGYFADRPASSLLFALRKMVAALFAFDFGLGSRAVPAHLLAGLVVLALLAAMLVRERGAAVPPRLRACLWAVLPVVLAVLAGGVARQVPFERYLAAPAGGLAVIMLAGALGALRSRRARGALMAATLGLNLVSALVVSRVSAWDVDFRPAFALLASRVEPGDGLMLDPPSAVLQVERHLSAESAAMLSRPSPETFGHEDQYRRFAEGLLARGGRIWLLSAPCLEATKSWLGLDERLRAEFTLVEHHQAGEVSLDLFRTPADSRAQ